MTTTKLKSTLYLKFVLVILLSSELVNYVRMETEIPLLNDDQGNCWQIKYLKNNSHANKTGINSNVDDDNHGHDDNDHDYDEKKPKKTHKTIAEL